MVVRYIGKTESLMLRHGKAYEVISIERDWLRIVDESGEDYLYPPEQFEIVHDISSAEESFIINDPDTFDSTYVGAG